MSDIAKKSSRTPLVIAGFALSATFVWIAAKDVDLAVVRKALLTARLELALPFLSALFAYYWVKSARWREILDSAVKVRTTQLFPAVMIGYAGSSLLPLQLGELVKVYVVKRQFELPAASVLASVGAERVLDFLTIPLIVSAVLAFGGEIPPQLQFAVTISYFVAGLVLSITLLYLLFPSLPQTILAHVPLISDGIREAAIDQLAAAERGVKPLKKPGALLRVIALSLIQWILILICVHLSMLALGISVPFSASIITMVLMIVSITLPTSPGYVGSFQIAYYLALLPYGVDPSVALGASVFYHTLAYGSVLIVGLYFAHQMGLRLRQSAAQALDP